MRKSLIRMIGVGLASALAIPTLPTPDVPSVSALTAGKFTTQYRGAGRQEISDVVVNTTTGDVFLTGWTTSVPNAIGPITNTDGGTSSTAFISKISLAGQVQWTKEIGRLNYDRRPTQMAIDTDGNVYVTLTDRPRTSGGKLHVQVLKYSADGVEMWGRTLASLNGEENSYGIDVRGANVAVLYSTTGTVGVPVGLQDMVLAKLNSGTGAVLKQTQFGTQSTDIPSAGVKFLADGSVIVGGATTGVSVLSPARLATRVDEDYYWAKYDPTFTVRTVVRQWGSTSNDRLTSIAVQPDGNFFLSGNSSGTVEGLVRFGGVDSHIYSMAPTNTVRWSVSIGTAGDENIVELGTWAGASHVQFFGTTNNVVFDRSAGLSDVFGGTIDPNGVLTSRKQLGTSGHDLARAFAIRAGGSPVLAGLTSGTFDGVAANSYDGFIISPGIDIGSVLDYVGSLTKVVSIPIPATVPIIVNAVGENIPVGDVPASVDPTIDAGQSTTTTVAPPLCNEASPKTVLYRRLVAVCAGLLFKQGTKTYIRLSLRNKAGVCSLSPRRRLKLNAAGNCKVKIRVVQTNGKTTAAWIVYKVA